VEKLCGITISGIFGTYLFGMIKLSVLFGEATYVPFAELGIAALVTIVMYKIISKLIDVLGEKIMSKLENHNREVREKMDNINNKIIILQENTSTIITKEQADVPS
jgi:hypothetical protein